MESRPGACTPVVLTMAHFEKRSLPGRGMAYLRQRRVSSSVCATESRLVFLEGRAKSGDKKSKPLIVNSHTQA